MHQQFHRRKANSEENEHSKSEKTTGESSNEMSSSRGLFWRMFGGWSLTLEWNAKRIFALHANCVRHAALETSSRRTHFLEQKKKSKGDIAVRSMDRSPLARRVAESRVIMYTHVANYVGADLIMKNGQRFNSNDKYSALPGILFSIFFSFIIRLFATSMASKSRSVFFSTRCCLCF